MRETPADSIRKLREDRLAAREHRLATKARYDAVLRVAERAREVGDVSPAVVLTLEVRAAEIASGMDLGLLLPKAPVGETGEAWITPTQISAILDVSTYRVGRAITALRLRGNPEFSLAVLNTAQKGTKTVTSYTYRPDVADMVRVKLVDDGHLVADGGAK